MTTTLKICEKRRYADRKEAEEMIRFLVLDGRAEGVTLGCYKCHVCHCWHLTSKKWGKKGTLTLPSPPRGEGEK